MRLADLYQPYTQINSVIPTRRAVCVTAILNSSLQVVELCERGDQLSGVLELGDASADINRIFV